MDGQISERLRAASERIEKGAHAHQEQGAERDQEHSYVALRQSRRTANGSGNSTNDVRNEMSTCRSPSLSLELGTPITPGFEALVFKASRGIEDIYELTAHMPVIALSANAMPRDIEKGMRAGFFRYLTKPIKVNEFTATLEVAMNFAGQGMFQDT